MSKLLGGSMAKKQTIYIVVEVWEGESCLRDVFYKRNDAKKYAKQCEKETGNTHDIVPRKVK